MKYLFVVLAVFSVIILGCNQAQVASSGNKENMQKEMSMSEKCKSFEEREKSGTTQWTAEEKELMEKCESMEKQSMEEESMMAEEGFEMKDGKMMMVNEKTKTMSAMDKDATLNDGTKVMTSGKVIKADGTSVMLKEGESIWIDGTVMKAGEMMKEGSMENGIEMMEKEYKGKVLAGTTSKYLEFKKADYEKALNEQKKILLYFYASWCGTCKAEQPRVFAAFNELNDPNLVGFRVNYKDSDTDADEQALAEEFQIPYQHTKVIIKNGKQVLKAPDSWDKQRYMDELAKV